MFGDDKCSRACLVVSAVFGLLVAALGYWNADYNMVVSLILGLLGFGVGNWVLRTMVCGETAEGSLSTRGETPRPAAAAEKDTSDATGSKLSAAPVDEETATHDAETPKHDEPAEAPTAGAASATEGDYDGDGEVEGKNEGEKPATLKKARGGKADDLKQIKGVGPKMEELLNSLGFFHFDQLASWSDQQVAWVDANLEGFKGRVSRDDWVAQAKILADGGETEFSKRVDDGGVY